MHSRHYKILSGISHIFSSMEWFIVGFASLGAILASAISYENGWMIAYGDSESHLNIAKRTIDGLTPGLAQLGGIWLPVPHLLMIPFVNNDFLWRSGLAGAIVSGVAYIITALYVYRLIMLVTHHPLSGFLGTAVFLVNPNILYLQSTAMTELPLMVFSVISTYYFIKFLLYKMPIHLIFSAAAALFASLSRYDGWYLIIVEGVLLLMYYIRIFLSDPQNRSFIRKEAEGMIIFYSTVACIGIALWFLWDYLILGDPLYFTNSPFSAKSQQQGWLVKNMLPAHHNLWVSFQYYALTMTTNAGIIMTILSVLGAYLFLFFTTVRYRWSLSVLLLTPFAFNVTMLYLGQSVIFIPELTPAEWEWNLFNVRYGSLMIPAVAFYAGYTASFLYRSLLRSRALSFSFSFQRVVAATVVGELLLLIITLQTSSFAFGIEKVYSFEDGVHGLSAHKSPDAQKWIAQNYDGGLVLLDDYARTISIIRSGIPMEDIIYVGTKPYWEETLERPERHAQWIVMHENDTVWHSLYTNPERQAYLYAHYEKAYTSDEILVFKRQNRYAYSYSQ